jgi:small subunit ribosomal protein S20
MRTLKCDTRFSILLFLFSMPILRSAQKQLRQNEKHRLRNNHFRDMFREARVRFERLVKATDTAGATADFPKLQKVIDTLCKKNIIHKNNAARKKSRFAGMLAALTPSK